MATLERDNRSLSDVARHLGLRRQSVYVWQDIPIEWIAAISEYSGIPPRYCRPDLAAEISAALPDADGNALDKLILALSRTLSRGARQRIEAQTRSTDGEVDGSKDRRAETAA